MADVQDLGSCAARRVGSTPTTRTIENSSAFRFLTEGREHVLPGIFARAGISGFFVYDTKGSWNTVGFPGYAVFEVIG